MAHRYHGIAFTEAVKAIQEEHGSRDSYARRETGPVTGECLGAGEASFIGERDSFYIASVSETGWPYVQHRGGPKGFVRVLDERSLAFPDFSGNRQYITAGNLQREERVSLLFMDYPNRARLKVYGRARVIPAIDATAPLAEGLRVAGYRARVEGFFLIHLEAFDWNCAQHITPRFTEAEVSDRVLVLQTRISELEGLQNAEAEDAEN